MWLFNHFKKKISIYDYLIKENERTSEWDYTWEKNKEWLPQWEWKMVYKDGRIYEWEWKNWKRSWNWFIQYSDWSEYEWERKDDMPYWHGKWFLDVEIDWDRYIYAWEFYNWIFHWNWSLSDRENCWYIWEWKNWKKSGKWSSYFPGFTRDAAWHCVSWKREDDDMIQREMSFQIDYDSFQSKMEEKVRNKFHDEENRRWTKKKNSNTLPSIERQYECVRVIAECYEKWNFDNLFPYLSDDVKWFSQRRMDDVKWKDDVINYYKWKTKNINNDYCCVTQIVELVWNINRDSRVAWAPHSGGRPGKVMLFYEDGKLCVFMSQYIDWEQFNSMIVPEYKWDEICSIWICMVDLYKYKLYWPWNWEQVNWWKWIPKYEETDTLRNEELCDFACNIVHDYFIKKEWYQILFASSFLSAFPNFALRKNWETILVIVRGWEVHNMPELHEKEKECFIKLAKKQWYKLYFAPVWFWASNPIRFDEKLLLRWDWFYVNFEWITPLVVNSSLMHE